MVDGGHFSTENIIVPDLAERIRQALAKKGGKIENVAIYNVLGINLEGKREILGHWIGDGGEGANFWLSVIADLQLRIADQPGLRRRPQQGLDVPRAFPITKSPDHPITKSVGPIIVSALSPSPLPDNSL